MFGGSMSDVRPKAVIKKRFPWGWVVLGLGGSLVVPFPAPSSEFPALFPA